MKSPRCSNRWLQWVCCWLLLASVPAWANGVVPIGYTYDSDDRLTQVTYPDGRQIVYAYDDMGNVTSITTRNDSPPAVLIGEAINGMINVPIADYQVLVNRPAGVTGYTVTGLPGGLKVNKGPVVNTDGKAPGVIYGTPTVGGAFNVQVSAKSAVGTGSVVTLRANIANAFTQVLDGYDLVGKAVAIVPISAISGGEIGGAVAVSVATNGGFSGTLTLGTKAYRFKEVFDGQYGGAVVMIDRPGSLPDLTLSLTLGLQGSTRGMLFGTLSDGITTTTIDGNISVFGGANRATAFSGAKKATYNVAVMPNGAHVGNNAFPQGAGYALVKITNSGGVSLSGKLADGTAFSGSSILFWNGEAPVFVPLYRGQGVFTGTMAASDSGTIDIVTDNRISGDFVWQRRPMAGNLYAAGFPTPMNTYLGGGVYVPPARGWRVMDLGNGASAAPVQMDLFYGGLPGWLTTTMTISAQNVVTTFTPNANAFALKFTPASGLFSGRFTAFSPGRTANFYGVIVPAFGVTQSKGYGHFLMQGATASDPVLSGQVNLTPLVLIP